MSLRVCVHSACAELNHQDATNCHQCGRALIPDFQRMAYYQRRLGIRAGQVGNPLGFEDSTAQGQPGRGEDTNAPARRVQGHEAAGTRPVVLDVSAGPHYTTPRAARRHPTK